MRTPKEGLWVRIQSQKGVCLLGSFKPRTFQKISFVRIRKGGEGADSPIGGLESKVAKREKWLDEKG